MNLSDSKKKLALAGVVCGIVAACLAYFGNPANMAFCIACFIRDTAGSSGTSFHRDRTVCKTGDYRSCAGFIYHLCGDKRVSLHGRIVAYGTFCPGDDSRHRFSCISGMSAPYDHPHVRRRSERMDRIDRLRPRSGTGVIALKKGFSLGRAHLTNRMSGGVLPVLMLGIFVLALATTLLKSSQSGPGSMHAPIILSLIGGLIFGAFAQKSRMCFAEVSVT